MFLLSQVGHFRRPATETGLISGETIKEAINAIKVNGTSFFTLAVMSGKLEAMEYAYDLICCNFQNREEVTIPLFVSSGILESLFRAT